MATEENKTEKKRVELKAHAELKAQMDAANAAIEKQGKQIQSLKETLSEKTQIGEALRTLNIQLEHDLKVAKSMVKNDENLATIAQLRDRIEELESTLERERDAAKRREEKRLAASPR